MSNIKRSDIKISESKQEQKHDILTPTFTGSSLFTSSCREVENVYFTVKRCFSETDCSFTVRQHIVHIQSHDKQKLFLINSLFYLEV